MNEQKPVDTKKVVLNTLSTGVPDLDAVLGGGLPEYSFNIIAGSPGPANPPWTTFPFLPPRPRASRPVLHNPR